MGRSRWENGLIVLPIVYFVAWFRGAISFISHDVAFSFPALILLSLIIYFFVWIFRVRIFLLKSEVGEEYLNLLVLSKVSTSVGVFFVFWIIAEIAPLIAYPFIYILAVFFSMLIFSSYKRFDVTAIKNILFKSEVSNRELVCYKLLCGGLLAIDSNIDKRPHFEDSHSAEFSISSAASLPVFGRPDISDSLNSCAVPSGSSCSFSGGEFQSWNPASGLPMTNYGVDVGGNLYGLNHDMYETITNYDDNRIENTTSGDYARNSFGSSGSDYDHDYHNDIGRSG